MTTTKNRTRYLSVAICTLMCFTLSTTHASSANTSIKSNIENFSIADVNGDGNVNSTDAAEILIYAAEQGAYSGCNCGCNSLKNDVNGDGKVNAADAAKILIYAAEQGAVSSTEPVSTTTTTTPIVSSSFNVGTKLVFVQEGWNVYSDSECTTQCGWLTSNDVIEVTEVITKTIYKVSYEKGSGYIYLDVNSKAFVLFEESSTTTETTTSNTTEITATEKIETSTTTAKTETATTTKTEITTTTTVKATTTTSTTTSTIATTTVETSTTSLHTAKAFQRGNILQFTGDSFCLRDDYTIEYSSIVAYIHNGDTLTVLYDYENGWYSVMLSTGLQGSMKLSTELFTVIDNTSQEFFLGDIVVFSGSSMNLRTEPNNLSQIERIVHKGDVLVIFQESVNGWYYVESFHEDWSGWLHINMFSDMFKVIQHYPYDISPSV